MTRLAGPLSRLDRRIADLEAEKATLDDTLRALKADVRRASNPRFHVPSHRRQLRAWWRESFERGRAPEEDPAHFFENKLNSYRWARSHGVDHPPLLGVWVELADIPWDDLPDEVVVKCAHSHASQAVLPIRRAPGGWRVVTEQTVRTSVELSERLGGLMSQNPRFAGPFFAERLMSSPEDPELKPIEVKAFGFDGEVAWLQVRRGLDHNDPLKSRAHYMTPEGVSIDQTYRNSRTDTSMPVPAELPRLVEVVRTLSRATRRSCVRVDLYLHDGVVFGELTPYPNRYQVVTPEWDARMGALWEAADLRVMRDAAAGRGLMPEWGDGPRTLLRSEDWIGGVVPSDDYA